MGVSQRIYDQTKKKLDELQARMLLERLQEKKMSLPELIENTVEFAKKHEDEFKQMIQEKNRLKNQEYVSDRPEFLKIIDKSSGTGSPEDFIEYNFNDI